MGIRALIVDDEPKNRRILEAMLAKFCPEVAETAAVSSVDEALEKMPFFAPDVLFLDIEMPRKSGFELLARADRTAIVFVTGHPQYALKALKAGAADYLLKPIDIDELQAAVRKIAARIEPFSTEKGPTSAPTADRFAVATKNQVEYFSKSDLERLVADSGGTWLHFADGQKRFSSKSIGEFEALFSTEKGGGSSFFRAHHAALVNLRFVKKIDLAESVCWLASGAQIAVSQRRKQAFLAAMNGFSDKKAG